MNECITNPSLLSANKFAVIISKFPGVQFFAQKVDIPSVRIGENKLYTNKDIDVWLPGDKVQYDELNISFLLDENLVSYSQLKNWMHEATNNELRETEKFADITILALTNNNVKNAELKFQYAFPVHISSFTFDSTRDETTPIITNVSFKFTTFVL